MRMNTNIPLSVQPVNALAAIDAGNTARFRVNQEQHLNALRPLEIQSAQLGLEQQRSSIALGREQLAEIRRQAQERAAAFKDKDRLKAERDQLARVMNGIEAGDPRAIQYAATTLGIPDTLLRDPNGRVVLREMLAGTDEELVGYSGRLTAASKGAQIDPVTVQSSENYPDGTTLLIMRDGSRKVLGPDGKELFGADAAKAIDQGQRKRADYDRATYYGRTEGANQAEAATGAEAAAAGERGKQGVALAGDFFNESRNIRSNLRNLQSAITAIDEGAKSGVVYNMLPDVTAASASLRNAMNQMGLDVIGSVTFGALSEGEMRLAMETAVPQNLEPAELRKWLVRKRDAQEKALEGVEEAVAHFSGGGTLEGWNEKVRGWSNGNRAQPEAGAAQGETGAEYADFEAFSASEAIQNAARTAGVSVEGMWEIYQQRQGQ